LHHSLLTGPPSIESCTAPESTDVNLFRDDYLYTALIPEKVFPKSAVVSGSTGREAICPIRTNVMQGEMYDRF